MTRSELLALELEEELSRKKKKKKRTLLPLLILLLSMALIAGGIALLVVFFGPREPEPSRLEREIAAELGILPGMSQAEIEDRLNRVVADSMVNVSINPTPVCRDGRSPCNLSIENIPGNSCSFTVTILRGDTGEALLTTGVIDPGSYVTDKPLDVVLPKGQYDCLAMFTAYNTETLEELGRAGVTLVITVEN